jgi:hypothetical protein
LSLLPSSLLAQQILFIGKAVRTLGRSETNSALGLDSASGTVSAAGAATGGAAPTPNQSGVRSGRQPIRSSDREQRLKRSGSPEASALYTAFQQLLLEDDSLD